jgi:acetyltransferase-like isoleucine patch superfamily enzyme
MKVGRIEIGRGATIGSGSTILYDSKIGDFAQIRPLTLVMKGESIPPHSIWAGSPAQPVRAAATGSAAGIDRSDRAEPALATA